MCCGFFAGFVEGFVQTAGCRTYLDALGFSKQAVYKWLREFSIVHQQQRQR